MRRTTQWAVFTSMNKQQPAWRSLYERVDHAGVTDGAADGPSIVPAQADPDFSTAPDTRRDRVDFM